MYVCDFINREQKFAKLCYNKDQHPYILSNYVDRLSVYIFLSLEIMV